MHFIHTQQHLTGKHVGIRSEPGKVPMRGLLIAGLISTPFWILLYNLLR
jgi:hypothetical protein